MKLVEGLSRLTSDDACKCPTGRQNLQEPFLIQFSLFILF